MEGSGLRFDGLYADQSGGLTRFIRFYPDDTAASDIFVQTPYEVACKLTREAVTAAGAPPQPYRLEGDQIRFDERPLPSRSHATRLPLTPGADQLIYLRISTRSTMIVPVRLIDADLWYEQETHVQLLQGLLAGIALCLVLYALGHWLGRHERLYLVYAVSVGGVSLFFFSYFGLGSQHLWPGHA